MSMLSILDQRMIITLEFISIVLSFFDLCYSWKDILAVFFLRLISLKMGSQEKDDTHNGSFDTNPHCPRLCHLRRWEGLSYGFNLISKRGQTGHFVDNIENGLPAYYSGLKDGDRVVEIDGIDVSDMPHREVVKMIKDSGREGMKMLVVDLNTEEYFRDKGFKIKSSSQNYRIQFINCPHEKPEGTGDGGKSDYVRNRKKPARRSSSLFKRFSTPEPPPQDPDSPLSVETVYATLGSPPEPTPRNCSKKSAPKIPLSKKTFGKKFSSSKSPTVINGLPINGKESPRILSENPTARLCHMSKAWDDDFGFILRTYKDTQEKVIVKVDKNSVAERTGIRENDHVIEINGVNVAKENHSQTCERIKNHGNALSLLVVGAKDMIWFRRQSVVPKAQDCVVFTTRPSNSLLKETNGIRNRDGNPSEATHDQEIPVHSEPGTSALSAISTLRHGSNIEEYEATPTEEYQMQEFNKGDNDAPIKGVPLDGSTTESHNESVSTRSSNNGLETASNDSKLLDTLNMTAAEVRKKIAREGNRKRESRISNRTSRVTEEQMI
jgi:hypothetical protein